MNKSTLLEKKKNLLSRVKLLCAKAKKIRITILEKADKKEESIDKQMNSI